MVFTEKRSQIVDGKSLRFMLSMICVPWQEYNEEIERLRRDLQASRDKNGIFLAQENYEYVLFLLI